MPLELTHAAQREWKSYEKWSYVYSPTDEVHKQASGSVNASGSVHASGSVPASGSVHAPGTTVEINRNHSATLCEIYGKGAAAAKALLRTKSFCINDPAVVLVIGSGICDLPNALCDTFKHIAKIYWLSNGFTLHKKLNPKVEVVESIPKVQFDVCIDNGDLDEQCFRADLGDVSGRMTELLGLTCHQLIVITVSHDAIIKNFINLFLDNHEYSMRVLRNIPPYTKSSDFVPFAITFSITKKNANVEPQPKQTDEIVEQPEQSRPVELPPGHIYIRQAVNIDGKWTFREAHMHILRLPRVVKEWRMDSFIRRIVPKHLPGVLRQFDIVDDQGKTSYSISMYDRRLYKTAVKTVRQLKPCVAVMVPLADDHHWLYRTVTGHQRLAEKAGTKRVLCVFLPSFPPARFGENINSAIIVEQIRKDIGGHLIQLNSDPKKPVLLMTQQQKFEDERKEVASRLSDLQGQILVYDVVVDKHDEEFKEDPEADTEYHSVEPSEFTRRTLIMESNPRVAQTEVWYTKLDDDKPKFVFTHICHSYQIPILQIVLTILCERGAPVQGALLGTGGGLLYSLFRTVFGNDVQLECVELDQTILDLATEYFGYTNDNTVVMNALDYVRDKSKCENKLDYLVVDINGTLGVSYTGLDDVTGPHRDFLRPEFLFDAASCVSELGCVILNSVCQTREARKALGRHLKSHFPKVISAVYSDELNVIFVCFGDSNSYSNDSLHNIRKKFLDSAKKYPMLEEVVQQSPLYLGAKSKISLNVM